MRWVPPSVSTRAAVRVNSVSGFARPNAWGVPPQEGQCATVLHLDVVGAASAGGRAGTCGRDGRFGPDADEPNLSGGRIDGDAGDAGLRHERADVGIGGGERRRLGSRGRSDGQRERCRQAKPNEMGHG